MNSKALIRMGATISFSILIIIIFFSLVSAQAASAAPDIRYVASGGDCGAASPCYSTLQAAVDASSAGDEIRVAAGMYPIQGGADQVVLVDRDLTIKGGYTTSDWTTPDPDANATILNALTQGRVMVISSTVEATVEGLQLIYGSSIDLGNGGGIYADGASLTLRHSWVMTNTADSTDFGGGIFVNQSTLLVDSCVIQANTAGAGAGIRILDSQATIQDSLIVKNATSGGTSSQGGGGVLISGPGHTTMTGNVVLENETSWLIQGGGVSLVDTGYTYGHDDLSLYLYDNLIEGNYSGGGGGVRVAKVFTYMNITAEIISNTIRDNYSFYGGAGISAGTHVTITHNLITENHAGLDPHDNYVDYGTGGGMAIYDNALVEYNRIIGNEARGIASNGYGGGAELHGGGEIIFRHNQVIGNHGGGTLGGRGGGIYIEGDNVIIESNLIQGNGLSGSDYHHGGAGVYMTDADVRFNNNILSDNAVSGEVTQGSGITIQGGSPTLIHNTIVNNTGGGGQGVYVTDSSDPGQPVFYNTIVASQTVGIQVDNSDTPQNLATLYGVLWANNADDYAGSVYAFDETTGDPAFVDPAGWDYHITPASAAIDMGVDSSVIDDIDGEPRFGTPDLGADEYWEPGALQRRFIPIVAK